MAVIVRLHLANARWSLSPGPLLLYRASRLVPADLLPAFPPPSLTAGVRCPRYFAAAEDPREKRQDEADNRAHTRRQVETYPLPAPRCRCHTCRQNWRTNP